MRADENTHVCVRSSSHVNTSVHTGTSTYKHVHTCTHVHARASTSTDGDAHAETHAYTHMHVTCAETHTHMRALTHSTISLCIPVASCVLQVFGVSWKANSRSEFSHERRVIFTSVVFHMVTQHVTNTGSFQEYSLANNYKRTRIIFGLTRAVARDSDF